MSDVFSDLPEGYVPVKEFPGYMIGVDLTVRRMDDGHRILEYKEPGLKGAAAKHVKLLKDGVVHKVSVWDLGVSNLPPF